MKLLNLIVLIAITCITTNAFCQQSIVFDKQYSFDNQGSYPKDFKQTPDGGYICAGSIGFAMFDIRFLLFKTDSLGNLEWYKYQNNPSVDCDLWAVDITKTGSYVGIGVSLDNPNWHHSAAIVMYNNYGDTLWSKQYAFPITGNASLQSKMYFYDGLCTEDNSILAVGSIVDSSFSNPLVVKTDMNGDTLWTWRLHKVQNTIVLESVAETADGDYVAVGRAEVQVLDSSKTDAAPNRGIIVKLNPDGELIYLKEWTDVDFNVFKDIYIDKDGNFVIVGTYIIYEPDVSYHVLLVKTDANGNTMYYRQISYGRFDSGMCLTCDINNNIYLLNMYTTPLAEDWPDDVLLQKYTPDGELLWQHSIGGQNIQNWPYEIVSTTDGGIAFCGLYHSDGNYSWLVKTDSLGNGPYGPGWINAVPENNFNAEVKVYPNPADQNISIKSSQAGLAMIIEFYDIYGRLIKTEGIADNHVYVGDLNNGNYIIRIITGNKTYVKKLMINR